MPALCSPERAGRALLSPSTEARPRPRGSDASYPPPHVLPKAGIHLIQRGLLFLPDRALRIDRVRGHWHASRLRAHDVPWIASSHVRRRPGGEIGRLGGKSRFGEGSETLLDCTETSRNDEYQRFGDHALFCG